MRAEPTQMMPVYRGATPCEVLSETGGVQLLHFKGAKPPRYQVPLLFVYALVNRPYILDLKPGRSVIQQFVQHGFDTYLIDWGVPCPADTYLGFDAYLNTRLRQCVQTVEERTSSAGCSLAGYCMGGTMSAAFAALHPGQVRNLMLLAAPIDFSGDEGLLNIWTRREYFDVDSFVDAYGNCPAEFLHWVFQMLKPVTNLIEKPINYADRMEDAKFVEDFQTTERWINDNIPVAGEMFREFVKYLYQENRLVNGTLEVGGRCPQLGDIICPLLNIAGEKDDLVPCMQSLRLNDLVGSRDRRSMLVRESGHIGLAIGGKAHREVWPAACEWLGERSGRNGSV